MCCSSDKVREVVKEKARDGKLSCPEARKIAKELGVPTREVGCAANELKIKLYGCELGCF
ncbi:MAG: hypothetical protein QMD08_06150 [Actinomycetota bacterium]|nr:hypothetical protein [Actinomycetota bacterium]